MAPGASAVACGFCASDIENDSPVVDVVESTLHLSCFREAVVPLFQAAISFEFHYPARWGNIATHPRDFQSVLLPEFAEQYTQKEAQYLADQTTRDVNNIDGLIRGRDYQCCPACGIPCCLRDACNFVACACCLTGFCMICGQAAEHDSNHWTQTEQRPDACPRFNGPIDENAQYDHEPQPLPPPEQWEMIFPNVPGGFMLPHANWILDVYSPLATAILRVADGLVNPEGIPTAVAESFVRSIEDMRQQAVAAGIAQEHNAVHIGDEPELQVEEWDVVMTLADWSILGVAHMHAYVGE
ncbi:hypothetical protein EJ03DRAFT_373131 [Teratosphaeria nubilosa]|uniref:IBR domain-containing protein n=1 Tax=Teratosphaeria nubilosa TaxID=161662 RepID=A0A6G1LEM9_9PEZI|nr:hypothetical protein EJ03DRAFT_373131 [Teratosphaeria nubilosa]